MMNQTSYWTIRNFFQTNIGCSWKKKRILNLSWNQLLGNLIIFFKLYLWVYSAKKLFRHDFSKPNWFYFDLSAISSPCKAYILISLCPGFILIFVCQGFICSVYRFYLLCVQIVSSLCAGFIFSVKFKLLCLQHLSFLCTGFIFSRYTGWVKKRFNLRRLVQNCAFFVQLSCMVFFLMFFENL